ncbi:MAG: hypothetical protein ACHQ51_03365 [Elusimicrobiota bacterium]
MTDVLHSTVSKNMSQRGISKTAACGIAIAAWLVIGLIAFVLVKRFGAAAFGGVITCLDGVDQAGKIVGESCFAREVARQTAKLELALSVYIIVSTLISAALGVGIYKRQNGLQKAAQAEDEASPLA